MRLIDADALIEKLVKIKQAGSALKGIGLEPLIAIRTVGEMVQAMPTVDAAPVVHGRWLQNDNGTYLCGRCKSWIPNKQHYYARYCLYCALMDGGD